jgi:hypothetical protein
MQRARAIPVWFLPKPAKGLNTDQSILTNLTFRFLLILCLLQSSKILTQFVSITLNVLCIIIDTKSIYENIAFYVRV